MYVCVVFSLKGDKFRNLISVHESVKDTRPGVSSDSKHHIQRSHDTYIGLKRPYRAICQIKIST